MKQNNISEPFIVDLAEDFAHNWQESLNQVSQRGSNHFCVRLNWAAHEKTRGIRDFSKSPSLRLEKFLRLVQESSLTVDVEVGFPFGLSSYPNWLWRNEPKSLVPHGMFAPSQSPFTLCRIPSLFSDEARACFTDFFKELVGIVELYHSPNGPVKQVLIDTRPLILDMNAFETCPALHAIEGRYRTCAELNTIYGASYRSLESAFSVAGYRNLADKRSWLAAYDYHFIRGQMLSQFKTEVIKAAKSAGESTQVKFFSGTHRSAQKKNSLCYLESTLLGGFDGQRLYPLLPFATPLSAFQLPYQGAQNLWFAFENEGLTTLPLAPFEDEITLDADLIVLVAGKYLPRRHFDRFQQFLSAGGSLLFSNGVPCYDENLGALEWKTLPKSVSPQDRLQSGTAYTVKPLANPAQQTKILLACLKQLVPEAARDDYAYTD